MDRQNRFLPEFYRALTYCIDNQLYLGEGNPNAGILIVGKECAIGDAEFGREIGSEYGTGNDDAQRYILKEKAVAGLNLDGWNRILREGVGTEQIEAQIGQKAAYSNRYYPLFPHLGQKYQQRRKGGAIGDEGTSPTWYFYQKLADKILGHPIRSRDDLIDFHLGCFHTEMNQIPLPMSGLLPGKLDYLRAGAIEKRKALFRQPFFRRFPVVILAVGHYPRNYSFDIEEIFDVDFRASNRNGSDWWNLHYNRSGSPRMLIHTRQFSMVSDAFVEGTADLCRRFVADHGRVE